MIDLEGPSAGALRELVDAHREGRISLAISATSASERQQDGEYSPSFRKFENKLSSLDLDSVEVLAPSAYLDVSYLDHCVLADDEMVNLERRIHAWEQLAQCQCDVQAMWCHIRDDRDVFVTTDRNFHKASKKPRLVELGAGRIETPFSAVRLICTS